MHTDNKFRQQRQAAIVLAMPLALAGMTLVPQGVNAIPLRSGLVIEQQAKQSDETFAVKNVAQINPHTIEINYTDGRQMTLDFYGDNILRMFRDDKGGVVRDPLATPPAKILVESARRKTGNLSAIDVDGTLQITTPAVSVNIDKHTGNMNIVDLRTGKTVIENLTPAKIDKGSTSVTMRSHDGEYFYGGGVQNGRFSHRGESIAIENTNSWVDGGVASPTPFYWSTGGYGVMWNTFRPGRYDFGHDTPGEVRLQHSEGYLDMFVMLDATPVQLLNDFYQLTGNPVLMPKFGFYEGHLNAYNRDYWKEDKNGAMVFEDGKMYKESQKDNGGTKESLNGEKNNYQFSARAAIDRYVNNDMPLGWFLPNDGYGAGYGQTGTLDGNIDNLRQFGDYARSKGVEIGLWTQSDLHPKPGIEPLLQRDIVKEVRDAGV